MICILHTGQVNFTTCEQHTGQGQFRSKCRIYMEPTRLVGAGTDLSHYCLKMEK